MFACLVTQEFLKRIPSSNSLTAFGSHGSQPDSAAQGLQFSTIQKVANQAAAAYSQPSASDQTGDGGRTAILGVPRVASLDFFRQLLPVNQLNFAGSRPAAGTSYMSVTSDLAGVRNDTRSLSDLFQMRNPTFPTP